MDIVEQASANLAALKDKSVEWHAKSIVDRLTLLEGIRERIWNVCDKWADLQTELVCNVPTQNEADYGHIKSDAYAAGPVLAGRYATALIETFQNYLLSGNKWEIIHPHQDIDGYHVVQTLPYWGRDKITFAGWNGEIYLSGDTPISRGKMYDEARPGTCVILGAGNFSGPVEVFNKLFVERKVCIYKPNPVNGAVTSQMFSFIFQELIYLGYLVVLDDQHLTTREIDVAVASALIKSENCTEVMITGSNKTYDAIVWGTLDPQPLKEKKQKGEKAVTKQVDAELGNINVVTLIPGQWTDKELEHHAKQITAVRMLNGGHTCPAPQIVLVSDKWEQRKEFAQKLKQQLSLHPPVACYYPGVDKKYKQFKHAYSDAKEIEHVGNGANLQNSMNPLFIDDLTTSDICLSEESFCPVIGMYALSPKDQSLESFCEEATHFLNDKVWGNLATTVVIPDPILNANKRLIRKFISDLRYGAIGVNIWGGSAIVFPQLHHGAYPGNNPKDIQSGIGAGVGNLWLYDNLVKVVIWTPCIHPNHSMPPLQPQKSLHVMRRLTYFSTYPTIWQLIRLALAGLFGI